MANPAAKGLCNVLSTGIVAGPVLFILGLLSLRPFERSSGDGPSLAIWLGVLGVFAGILGVAGLFGRATVVITDRREARARARRPVGALRPVARKVRGAALEG